MNKQVKAICVLSGGMDSTTVLYKALKDEKNIVALSFNYGQRHNIELKKAEETCKKLLVPHKIVDISTINDLMQGSALTSNIKVPEGHYEYENMKMTVVPNRNMVFISLAVAYAVSLGASRVYIGVHAGDHTIYPDCRKEFIEAINKVTKIANYIPVKIVAPYLESNKIDIIREGKKLGVDYALTHTCYKGKKLACGKCGSCRERLEAFKANGIKDPVKYEKGVTL